MRQKRTVRASSVWARRWVWLGWAICCSFVRGDYDGPFSTPNPRNTHLEPYLAFGDGQMALYPSSLPTNTPSATDVNDALHICSGTTVKWPQDDPLITSVRSVVAQRCRGLRIAHI
jgi:hypothetical protein